MARRKARPTSGFDLYEAMDLLCSVETLLPSQKLLLFVLLKHADKDGECWPSVPRLSTATSLNQATIKRLLPDLQRLSVLHVMPQRRASRSGKASATSHLYRVDLAALRSLVPSPDKMLPDPGDNWD